MARMVASALESAKPLDEREYKYLYIGGPAHLCMFHHKAYSKTKYEGVEYTPRQFTLHSGVAGDSGSCFRFYAVSRMGNVQVTMALVEALPKLDMTSQSHTNVPTAEGPVA